MIGKLTLTNPFILAFIVSISFNLLFGYLSYRFYANAVLASQNLDKCQQSNASLEESVEKERKLCLIQDSVVIELNTEQQGLKEKEADILEQIDAIQSKPKQKVEQNAEDQEAPVPLDGKLPPALADSLREVYNRVQRQGDSDAR